MKVAICIVGKYEIDSIHINELIRCYDLNNNDNDIFIFSNMDSNNNNKLKNLLNNIKMLESMFDSQYHNDIVKQKHRTYLQYYQLYDYN